MRGATIAGMIVVNNPGTWSAVYPQLRHAEWHGWTYTDTIFPFFLFLVGVSMALSFGERRAAGAPLGALARKTVLRAAILIALGLCFESRRVSRLPPRALPHPRRAPAHRPVRARRGPDLSRDGRSRSGLGSGRVAPGLRDPRRGRTARPARQSAGEARPRGVRNAHVERDVRPGGTALDAPGDRDDASRDPRRRAPARAGLAGTQGRRAISRPESRRP